MRKLVMAAAVAAALAIGSHGATSATPSDRPPGIDAKNWIALGPNFGFLIDPTWTGLQSAAQSSPPDPPIALPPDRTAMYVGADLRSGPRTLRGYFIARHDGAWVRLAAIPSP